MPPGPSQNNAALALSGIDRGGIDRGRQEIDLRAGVRETPALHATSTPFVLAATIHYHPRLDSCSQTPWWYRIDTFPTISLTHSTRFQPLKSFKVPTHDFLFVSIELRVVLNSFIKFRILLYS